MASRPDREFGENVAEFVAIDDQLKSNGEATRKLNARRKELRTWIAAGMEDRGYTEVKICEGKQVLRVREKKVSPGRPAPEVIARRFQTFIDRCRAARRPVNGKEMYEWVHGKDGAAKEEAGSQEPEYELVLSRQAVRVPKKRQAGEGGPPKKQPRVVEIYDTLVDPCMAPEPALADVPSSVVDEKIMEERAMGMDS